MAISITTAIKTLMLRSRLMQGLTVELGRRAHEPAPEQQERSALGTSELLVLKPSTEQSTWER